MGTVRRFTEYVSTYLPELESNQIYISHVGDGEYEFNVFGSAWTDQIKLYHAIAQYFKVNPMNLIIGRRPNYDGSITDPSYWVIHDNGTFLVRLTIETINPAKFPNGYD